MGSMLGLPFSGNYHVGRRALHTGLEAEGLGCTLHGDLASKGPDDM